MKNAAGARQVAQPVPGRSAPGREALVETAMRLFGARGYAAVGMRELVAEAGVSLGLVRTHFGSKEGLREAVDAHALQAVQRLYASVLEDPAPLSLDSTARAAVAWGAENSELFAYIRMALLEVTPGSQALFDALYALMQSFVDGMDRLGRLQPRVDRDMVALFLLYDFLGAALVAPFGQKAFGMPMFDSRLVARRNLTMARLFTCGVFRE